MVRRKVCDGKLCSGIPKIKVASFANAPLLKN